MPNLNLANQTMPRSTPAGLLTGFLTKDDLAGQLRISGRTLDRWHSLRTGPPRTLIGGKVYYETTAARAWITAQREDVPQRRRA